MTVREKFIKFPFKRKACQVYRVWYGRVGMVVVGSSRVGYNRGRLW